MNKAINADKESLSSYKIKENSKKSLYNIVLPFCGVS